GPRNPERSRAVGAHPPILKPFPRELQSERVPLAVGPGYFVKAAVLFTTAIAIAAARRRAHHPFPRVGAANYATGGRALLVALVAAFIGETLSDSHAATVVGLGIVAVALDGVDGWLARRTRTTSAFGARFDMEIDAAFILALSILAWRFGKAGAW